MSRALEEELRRYGQSMQLQGEEHEKQEVARQAEAVFLQQLEKRPASWLEFLYEQCHFIRKSWWLAQVLMLVLLYLFVCRNQAEVLQRMMGVAATVFVLLVLPEIWKNQSNEAMEIEGTAYYSLRQIYMARLLIFTVWDSFLLCIFGGIVVHTTQFTVPQLMRQFLLPMIVTCCISLRMLRSRMAGSEYMAIFLSLLWTAVWSYLILQDRIYDQISTPLVLAICGGAVIYLGYSVCRLLQECRTYWEGDKQWN